MEGRETKNSIRQGWAHPQLHDQRIITIKERRGRSSTNSFTPVSTQISTSVMMTSFLRGNNTHDYVDWQGSSAGPDEGSGQAVPVEEEGNLFTQRKWENAARQSSRTREERRGIICIFRAEVLESDSTQPHPILWSSSVSA